MTAISLAVAGAAGRMGRELIRAIAAADDLTLAGGTERAGAPELGQDAGAVAGVAALGVALMQTAADAASSAQGWIDFTTPAATLGALDGLSRTSVKFAVVGTTGLDDAGEAKVRAAAQRIAIVRARNFSLGVNLLAGLVQQAAQKLGPDWDIEIVEAHHRHKIDAPSGTALMLGQAAAEGRGAPDMQRLPLRDGITGARPQGAIGFAVVRGGGIFGKHDVIFAAENEIVQLSHEALDRGIFVRGALAAARWAADKPPGLYSMKDVLGF